MRDRLIELIKKAEKEFSLSNRPVLDIEEYVADYLLANGVIVPPCKVGDIVYTIFEGEIEALKITYIRTDECIEGTVKFYDAESCGLKMHFADRHIGKSIFLTKEEAEAKLKEREG